MKLPIYILIFAIAMVSCIDKNYDLSNIDTDDVTLGGDGSEYRMPLANIRIGLDQLSQGNLDIKSIFYQADVWLPSPLPSGAQSVNLVALKSDQNYLQTLLGALVAQMMVDDQKLDLVTDYIWVNYRSNFEHLLSQIPGIDINDAEQYKTAFKLAFRTNDQIKNEATAIARSYLIDMDVDPLVYTIDPIGVNDEVVDMIAANIDGPYVSNPQNTLHIYGEIQSALPVGMRIDPLFVGTSVSFGVDLMPNAVSPIPQTRLFEQDVRTIFSGVTIRIPVTLQEYVPGRVFDPSQNISLKLSLLKRGGLTINL